MKRPLSIFKRLIPWPRPGPKGKTSRKRSTTWLKKIFCPFCPIAAIPVIVIVYIKIFNNNQTKEQNGTANEFLRERSGSGESNVLIGSLFSKVSCRTTTVKPPLFQGIPDQW